MPFEFGRRDETERRMPTTQIVEALEEEVEDRKGRFELAFNRIWPQVEHYDRGQSP